MASPRRLLSAPVPRLGSYMWLPSGGGGFDGVRGRFRAKGEQPVYARRLRMSLEPFFRIWLLVVGLCIGSFLNVVIGRMPLGQSVVRPGSRCPRCGHVLSWYENIPLLSWLALRAKCRRCRAPISWRYPGIELLTGLLFLAAELRLGMTWALVPALVLIALLVTLSFIDLAHWELPFHLTLPGTAAGVLLQVPEGHSAITDAAIGALAGFLIFRALEVVGELLFKREALGAGDKVLLAMIGAFLSWKALLGVIFLTALQGSVVGIALLLVFGKARPGEATPMSSDVEKSRADENPEKPLPVALHWVLWILGFAYRPGLTLEDLPNDEDWVPERTSVPLGPFLALAALEILLLGPWISEQLPGSLGTVLTGV